MSSVQTSGGFEKQSLEAPPLRLCAVRKRFPEEEYGFNLHAEKGKSQFIGKVDANSPAQVAGLQQGDRIIGVNGVLIGSESHKQVVSRIKQNPLETTLLVVDEAAMIWYDQRNTRLTYELPNIIDCSQSKAAASTAAPFNGTKNLYVRDPPEPSVPPQHHSPPEYVEAVGHNGHDRHSPPPPHFEAPAAAAVVVPPVSSYKPRPRLGRLIKTHPADEYGFNLHADRGKGHFVGKVDPDSIAEHAGLEQGQRIVGVNGTLIYPNTPHKDVVNLIRQMEMRTELLVATPEVDEFYRSRNLEFSFDHIEQVEEPVSSRGKHISPVVTANGHSNATVEHSRQSPKILHHDDMPVHHNGDHQIPSHKPVDLPSPSESSSSAASVNHHHADFHPNDGGHVTVKNGVMATNGSHSSPDSYGSTSRSPHSPELDPIFNLTAAELKERLAARKKKDAKKEQMSFKQKYDIVKNL